jgi:hypothetical protein
VLILAIGFGSFYFYKKSNASVVSSTTVKEKVKEIPRTISSLELRDLLTYSLQLDSQDVVAWTSKNENNQLKLVSEGENIQDGNGLAIKMQDYITVLNHEKSPNQERFVAMIAKGSEQLPKSDYPEYDSSECKLLVLKKEGTLWAKEFYGQMAESHYEGDTRFAKGCDGYTVKWVDERPVLEKSDSVGPYAGGVMVEVTENIHWDESKKTYINTTTSNEGAQQEAAQ